MQTKRQRQTDTDRKTNRQTQTDRHRQKDTNRHIIVNFCVLQPKNVCKNLDFLQALLERLELIWSPDGQPVWEVWPKASILCGTQVTRGKTDGGVGYMVE